MALTQAQIDKQNAQLRKLRIAEFINCPDCKGTGFSVEGLTYYNEILCGTCIGVGRIYFNRKLTLLDKWRILPAWKRANYVTLATFAGTVLAILAIMKACGVQ